MEYLNKTQAKACIGFSVKVRVIYDKNGTIKDLVRGGLTKSTVKPYDHQLELTEIGGKDAHINCLIAI